MHRMAYSKAVDRDPIIRNRNGFLYMVDKVIDLFPEISQGTGGLMPCFLCVKKVS